MMDDSDADDRIRLRVLGPSGLQRANGTAVRSVLAQPKRLALLTYLALPEPGVFHARDALLGLLWSERKERRGRDALNRATGFLRNALGRDVVVSRGIHELGLDPDRIRCDAAEMRRAVASGRHVEALELYRGELLDGVIVSGEPAFDRWLEAERAELQRLAMGAADTLVHSLLAEGDARRAVHWARWAAARAPYDETVHRRLMELLDRTGNRAEALRVHDDLAERLASDLEMAPSPATRELVRSLRDGRVHSSAPSDSPERPAVPAASPEPRDPPAHTTTGRDSAPPASSPPSGRRPRASRVRRHLNPFWTTISVAVLVAILAMAVVGSSSAVEVVAADELSVGDVVDLGGVRHGYVNGIIPVGEVRFAERFGGQSVRARDGYEVLGRDVARPLRLQSGGRGNNLFRGLHSLYGANLSGVAPDGLRGPGALAVLFRRDQAEVAVQFIRAEGGDATLRFYRRDGSLIDDVVLHSVQSDEYAFRRAGGAADIAGFSLHNRDPREGLSIARVRFDALTSAAPIGSADRIAVLPLLASGGPAAPELARDASRMLTAHLDGMGTLRSVRPNRLQSAAEGDIPVTLTEGRRVASSVDAGWFILGRVMVRDDRVLLRAALYAPGDVAAPVARAEAGGAPRELGSVTDRVTRTLLADAYEEATGSVPAAAAARVAPSVPDLRAFLAGERAWKLGWYDEAVERFSALADAGPLSTIARYRLSQAAHRNGELDLARRAADRARASADDGAASGDLERRIGAWHAFLSGRGRDAERGFRELIAESGTDLDAWYGLGETLVRFGPAHGRPWSETVEVFDEVLALAARDAHARLQMARLTAMEGQDRLSDFLARTAFNEQREKAPARLVLETEALRAALDTSRNRAEVLDRVAALDAPDRKHIARSVALFTGRLEWSRRLIAPLLEAEDPARRADALLWTAWLDAAAGRPRAALETLDRLAALRPDVARRARLLLATRPFFPALRRTLQTPEALPPQAGGEPEGVGVARGLLAAVRGDTATAFAAAGRLERDDRTAETPAPAAPVLARLALERSRPDRTRAILAALPRPFRPAGSPFGTAMRYTYALALAEEGEAREALRWLGTFPEHDIRSVIYRAPSHLRRARLHEELGETGRAVSHYRRFLELWRDPEPELVPVAKAARERLEMLRSSGP